MRRAESQAVQLSVVVPFGKDRGPLEVQLRALLNSGLQSLNAEVVVSCNLACERAWLDGLLRHPDFASTFRWVDSSAKPGPAAARNVGWRAAQGSKIAFCDSDDVVSPTWAEAMSTALDASPLVAGALDSHLLNPPALSSWWKHMRDGLEVKFDHLPFGPSANLGATRGLLEQVGGFDEELRIAEDIDLCWRAQYAGAAISFAPTAVVSYRLRATTKELWLQAYAYGRSDATLLRRHQIRGARRTVRATFTDLLATGWALARCPFSRPWRLKALHRVAGLTGRIRGSIDERIWAV